MVAEEREREEREREREREFRDLRFESLKKSSQKTATFLPKNEKYSKTEKVFFP